MRKLLAGAAKPDRRARRAAAGPLRALVVQPATERRYAAALQWFFSWLEAERRRFPRSALEVDELAAAALESAWEEGEPKALVGDLLSALQFRVPVLQHHLPLSWRLFKAWGRAEVPTRAPPLSATQVLAFAWVARCWGLWDVGLVALVAFACFLRTSEAVSLAKRQLTFSSDFTSAAVSLPETKGTHRHGGHEGVSFAEPALVRALARRCESLAPADRLLRRSPPHFRAALRCDCAELCQRGIACFVNCSHPSLPAGQSFAMAMARVHAMHF